MNINIALESNSQNFLEWYRIIQSENERYMQIAKKKQIPFLFLSNFSLGFLNKNIHIK